MFREKLLARMQGIIDLAKSENRDINESEKSELEFIKSCLNELERATDEEEGDDNEDEGTDTPNSADDEKKERERASQIVKLCREFEINPESYIQKGVGIQEVQAEILKGLKKESDPIDAKVTADENDKFRDAAADGIVARAGISKEYNEFSGMSLRDLGIECLSRAGENARELMRMDSGDIYSMLVRQFYNPTSAFPAIMDATIRKSIVELYNEVPTTFEQWTTAGSLPDFKESPDHEYVIGGLRDFEEVPENGELKNDIPETKLLPSRKLKTYGKQFSMTRQAFVNDDIGILTKIPGMYAAKAKKTIDKQVYKIIFDNSTIFDGKALFHNDHKNLISTGTAPTAQNIQKIILKMQKQTDHFGEPIYMTPQYLIVPMGYEFDLAVIFQSAQVTGSNNNDINPLYNYPLTVVQTPVLNAMAGANAAPWFITASQYSALGIQVDYLNGQKMPTVRRMEVPGTLGFVWDIWLDWGISVRDFRGIYRNNGVVIS